MYACDEGGCGHMLLSHGSGTSQNQGQDMEGKMRQQGRTCRSAAGQIWKGCAEPSCHTSR